MYENLHSIHTTIREDEFDNLLLLGDRTSARHTAEIARASLRFVLAHPDDFLSWYNATNGQEVPDGD